jgi:hypothetical protein
MLFERLAPHASARTTLSAIFELLRGQDFVKVTCLVREAKAEGVHAYIKAKKRLPGVTWSGQSEGGGRKSLGRDPTFVHSGYLQGDFDGKDNPGKTVEEIKETLRGDPHVLMVWTSPGGEGVKAVIRIPADVGLHGAAFETALRHFAAKGVHLDRSCKDLERLCFLNHDPEVWLREGSVEVLMPELGTSVDHPEPPGHDGLQDQSEAGGDHLRAGWTTRQIGKILSYIPPLPYEEWIKVIAGVADEVGNERAYKLLQEWSHEPDESENNYRAKLANRLNDVTFASVAHLATLHGWDPQRLPPWDTIPGMAEPPWLIRKCDDRKSAPEVPSATPPVADGYGPGALPDLLTSRRFDFNSKPDKPKPLFSLAEGCICTPGNLLNIQAPAKAGKSAAVTGLLAAAMADRGGKHDTLGFSAQYFGGKAIIHLDTEQSRFDHDQLVRRALKRAGVQEPPPWLMSYTLADLNIGERHQALENAIALAEEDHGGIFAIIIDGVADLCSSPNDDREAFALVAKLHGIALKHKCAVITIIHENPGSEMGKSRGHLGSELDRKVETTLRLAKDGDGVTSMWVKFGRHCDMPKGSAWCFKWCSDLEMHISVGTANTMKDEEKQELFVEEARIAFSGMTSLKYSELVVAIQKALPLKERAAKGRVKKWEEAGVVVKIGDRYQFAV